MKILVCIKRVPDLENITFQESPSNAVEDLAWEAPAWQMNRYDEYAMETALQLREARDLTRIDALTVGDHKTEDVLRRRSEQLKHQAKQHSASCDRNRTPLGQ